MKNFNFFSQLFSLVIFCFSTTVANAQQVNANSNFYTTGNPYTYAATAGSGSRGVVALIKPTSNQIRVSTYSVTENGAVTWKDNYDFSIAAKVKVAMLSDTRVVVARGNSVTVFDIDANGKLYKKGEWSGFVVNSSDIAVTKLSSSSFATLVRTEIGHRLVTFTVNAAGDVTKKAHKDLIYGNEEVDLVRLSDTRVVAAIKASSTQVKFICLDVHYATFAITQKTTYAWNNAAKRISLAHFSNIRFAAFVNDTNDKLDALYVNVNDAGTISIGPQLNDIKKPGTNDAFQLKDIAAQTISIIPGKILLSGALANGNLCVIPFSMGNGTLAVQSGGYYPNAPNVTQVSAGFITGNMMLGASRKIEDGKYHIGCYKWN